MMGLVLTITAGEDDFSVAMEMQIKSYRSKYR